MRQSLPDLMDFSPPPAAGQLTNTLRNEVNAFLLCPWENKTMEKLSQYSTPTVKVSQFVQTCSVTFLDK